MNRFIYFLLLLSICFACQIGEIEITVRKYYVMYSDEESWELWRGNPTDGVMIASYEASSDDDDTLRLDTLCTTSGLHTLVLKDTFGDGWGYDGYDAYIYVDIAGFTIFEASLPYDDSDNTYERPFPFTVELDILPSVTWKYTDAIQSNESWKSVSFDDSQWSSAASNSMPVFTSTVRYYRFQSNIINLETINTFLYSLKTNQAFVFYVQGVEVYRYGLPIGTITSTTLPNAELSNEITNKVMSIFKYILPTSGNYQIAIEVHINTASIASPDVFSFCGKIVAATSIGQCTHNIILSNNSTVIEDPVSTDTYDGEGAAFDNNLELAYSQNANSQAVLTYFFPTGYSHYFNSYSITTSDENQYGFPKSWSLYATQDGTNWILLDFQTNYEFHTTEETATFSLGSNTLSYIGIRLNITASSDDITLAVAEVQLYQCNKAYIAPGISYNPSSVTFFSIIDTISLYPASSGYHHFTITPPLPSGLSMNDFGVISGMSMNVFSQVYTISAVPFTSSESYTTTLTLNFVKCASPDFVQVRLRKINGYYSYEERAILYNEDGSILYTMPKMDGENWEHIMCIPSQSITVITSDTSSDGWDSGSYLYIDAYNSRNEYTVMSRILDFSGVSTTYKVNLKHIISPSSTSWKYLQGSLPENWYAITEPIGMTTYSTTTPTTTTSPIWIFRHSFTLSQKTEFSSCTLQVFARAGFIMYLNGQEMYRKNLPMGILSTSTTPTGGESNPVFFTVNYPLDSLLIGTNILAIGIINIANNNPTTMDFDATLILDYPNRMGRMWDIEISDEPSNYDVDNLIDFDSNTIWSSTPVGSNTISVTLSFTNFRSEFINKYCLVSSHFESRYDPSDWGLFGSDGDLTKWTIISNVTNAYFSGREQERCFYLPDNKNSYSIYRFYFTESADMSTTVKYYLADIILSNEDIDSIVIPPLAYNITSAKSYVGIPFVEITPNSPLYGNYRISPPLDAPLELDTSTGSIRGTPKKYVAPTVYTITAKDPKGNESSTTITLSVVYCITPNVLFTIKVHSNNYGNEMSYFIKNSNGTIIHQHDKFTDYQDSYFPFCQPIGIYFITMKDSSRDGWNGGYIKVYLEDNTEILSGTLDSREAEATMNLSVGYVISPVKTEWTYYDSNTSPSSGWNTISFDDSHWTKNIPEMMNNAQGITQYYRKTFIIDNVNLYSALAFDIKTKYGAIVYINGEEVYRYNVPKGIVTESTSCIKISPEIVTVGTSVSLSFGPLVQSQNIFAIEIHRTLLTSTYPMEFDASVMLLADNSYRIVDGMASSSFDTTTEGINKLFDNTLGSLFVAGPECVDTTVTWTYNNNRKEYISSYALATGYNCNKRHPSGWNIEGSNDNGITWYTLDTQHKIMWTQYKQRRVFDFYNTRAFNAYRMVVTECSNQPIAFYGSEETNCDTFGGKAGFQLGELSFYSKRIESSCPEIDGFHGALNGSYGFKDCSPYYAGRIEALCTNGTYTNPKEICNLLKPQGIEYPSNVISVIQGEYFQFIPKVLAANYTCELNDNIPHGVTFNSETGGFSGATQAVFSAMTIGVTCKNSKGSFTKEISIISNEKVGIPYWGWIIIGVLVLIIVAIVLFCIINRLKSKKNRGHSKLPNKIKSATKSTKDTKAVKI
ncbi:hypothetical protein WA158_005183 [Blastocystis sp. Blastoise]